MLTLRTATILCRVALVAAAGSAFAEHLPLRVYTTADGLPRDQVHRIVRDREGFVWFLTAEGAARFDGERLRTFTPADGFPDGSINDLLESSDHVLWLATSHGLYRLERGRSPQRVAASGEDGARRVAVLHESAAGRVWAGDDEGVLRVERAGDRWHLARERPGPRDGAGRLSVRDLVEDAAGRLWTATDHGLFRREADGKWVQRSADETRAVTLGEGGKAYVATLDEVLAIDPASDHAERVATTGALRLGPLRDLLVASDGALWVAGCTGVARIDAGGRATTRTFWRAEGWPDTITLRLAEDNAGNIWAGTESCGVVRVAPRGFTGFDERDGLPGLRIDALLDDPAGGLLAVVGLGFERRIARFDGQRFHTIPLRLPGALADLGWGTHQVLLVDRQGDWWLATAHGLARWTRPRDPAELAARSPDAVYTTRDGLPGDEIFRLYEDRAGNVWVGTITLGETTLARFDREHRTFRVFGAADGAPRSAPSAFAEDARGRVWIGFYDGGLARVTGDRLRYFVPGDGGPRGFVWDIHLDTAGRLWVGSSDDGLMRVDDEESDPPRMTRWTRATGLSSNSVQCIADDAAGRVYVGTPRGVDRLEPASGEITHLTAADGLARSELIVAHRDRAGALWFGTLRGLSRLAPGQPVGGAPPAVRIDAVRVAGRPLPIDPLGETDVREFVIDADERQLDLDFGGLQLGGGGPLRFQYLVEGSGRGWSRATGERSLHFATLAPGRYRVQVRAVGPGGTASAVPAVVSFRVLRPVWQRWYSVVLAALVVAAALVTVHRLRTARLLELERVRTRIATDLHDDIGATLSEIAIAAEVARRQAPPSSTGLGPLLEHVASGAREMVDAMSDIVWSIDPQRDHVGDLVGRVRRFGGDLFAVRGMEFAFEAPSSLDDVALDANLRRELLLMLKEAFNNAARHSGATRVDAELRIEGSGLVLAVADNGRGFEPGLAPAGQGLRSLERRAARLGGVCTIASAPGTGTRIEIRTRL